MRAPSAQGPVDFGRPPPLAPLSPQPPRQNFPLREDAAAHAQHPLSLSQRQPPPPPPPPGGAPGLAFAKSASSADDGESEPPLPGLLEGEDVLRFTHEDAGKVRLRVKQMLGWKRSGFPGGQPVSLSIQNISELFRNAYVACEKTDGVRFLLLGADKRVYLIGRHNEVRAVEGLYLPRATDLSEAQENTLLDGELVADRHEGRLVWRYLVYDCMAVDGDEGIRNLNLLKRLQAAKARVTEPLGKLREQLRRERQHPQEDQHFDAEAQAAAPGGPGQGQAPFEIFLKDFYEIFDLEAIQRVALRMPHPSDGIIFTPVKCPYVTGTCPQLLKWKPPSLNTVDFSVEPLYDADGVPQVFMLKVCNSGIKTFMGQILAPYGDFYKKLYETVCGGNAGGMIVECSFFPSAPVYTFFPALATPEMASNAKLQHKWSQRNSGHPMYDFNRGEWKEGGWVAERLRPDKPLPNDFRVMHRVKRSIDDGVTFACLQKEIERFRQHRKVKVADMCSGIEGQ